MFLFQTREYLAIEASSTPATPTGAYLNVVISRQNGAIQFNAPSFSLAKQGGSSVQIFGIIGFIELNGILLTVITKIDHRCIKFY